MSPNLFAVLVLLGVAVLLCAVVPLSVPRSPESYPRLIFPASQACPSQFASGRQPFLFGVCRSCSFLLLCSSLRCCSSLCFSISWVSFGSSSFWSLNCVIVPPVARLENLADSSFQVFGALVLSCAAVLLYVVVLLSVFGSLEFHSDPLASDPETWSRLPPSMQCSSKPLTIFLAVHDIFFDSTFNVSL